MQMFDHMMKVNNLLPSFTKYNLTDKDVVFIKELIAGTALAMGGSKVTNFMKGRWVGVGVGSGGRG